MLFSTQPLGKRFFLCPHQGTACSYPPRVRRRQAPMPDLNQEYDWEIFQGFPEV